MSNQTHRSTSDDAYRYKTAYTLVASAVNETNPSKNPNINNIALKEKTLAHARTMTKAVNAMRRSMDNGGTPVIPRGKIPKGFHLGNSLGWGYTTTDKMHFLVYDPTNSNRVWHHSTDKAYKSSPKAPHPFVHYWELLPV